MLITLHEGDVCSLVVLLARGTLFVYMKGCKQLDAAFFN